MRYELSLASETFTPAVEAFDRQMIVLLRRMRQQHISEGSVSLKISVSLERQFPLDGNRSAVGGLCLMMVFMNTPLVDTIVTWVIVLTTLYSGIEYFVKNWKCLGL